MDKIYGLPLAAAVARGYGAAMLAELPIRLPFLRTITGIVMLVTIGLVLVAAIKGPRPADVIGAAGFETPPPSPPPAVEPVELQVVAPETARELNAKVPFAEGPNPAARPFVFAGSGLDRARATDCLASAIYYEAGAEAESGQRAVAQVVLNRVRHPAFPSTVCGVVYQGATRRTGCQFSFSCDGSMARLPSSALWERLRGLAREALSGAVYAPVGLATHYHTDWVLPYWSPKLDKITSERTHLFFKWRGWWGTPPAFRQAWGGHEPLIGRMARLSSAHATALAGEVPLDALPPGSVDESLAGGLAGSDALSGAGTPGTPVFASEAGNFLIYTVSRRSDPALLALSAKAACGTQPYCKVMMWTDPAITPSALPVSAAALDAMAFSYLRNEKGAFEKALWNCTIFTRPDPSQCMKARVPVVAAPAGPRSGPMTESGPAQRSASVPQPEADELIPMQRDDAPRPAEPVRKADSTEPKGNMIRRRPGS